MKTDRRKALEDAAEAIEKPIEAVPPFFLQEGNSGYHEYAHRIAAMNECRAAILALNGASDAN